MKRIHHYEFIFVILSVFRLLGTFNFIGICLTYQDLCIFRHYVPFYQIFIFSEPGGGGIQPYSDGFVPLVS